VTTTRARKNRALPRGPLSNRAARDAPRDEIELIERARSLSGMRIAELARHLGVAMPREPGRAKGFVGRLIERALGATAGSAPEPDFAALGVELKTIPLDRRGRPRESTFVCAIGLPAMAEAEWAGSVARKKLARVLWVPIESERGVAFAERRVGTPRLWSPSPEQEACLRADFEEVAGLIGRGDIELLDGLVGRSMQARPKAANRRVTTRGMDERGAPTRVAPRGFYLRTTFTAQIFALDADAESTAAQHLL
jgi:DNA mismatch repair protein MutH